MNLQEIKWLHGLGFGVHWLHKKSKRPIGNEWQIGPRKSWADLESEYEEGFNVGVRTGEPSKLTDGSFLYILDVDVKSTLEKHKKEAYQIVESFTGKKIEAMPRVMSGRGGASLHIYMRSLDDHASFNIARSKELVKVKMPSVKPGQKEIEQLTADEIKQGWRMRAAYEIDFYGTGKQAAMPPSIHPDSGKPYKWLMPVAEPKDLPTIIKARMNDIVKREQRDFAGYEFVDLSLVNINAKTKALIERLEGLENFGGDRSAALFSVINILIMAHLTRDQIISILIDPGNAISEVAYDRQPSEAGAARWVGSQVDKCGAEVSVEAKFVEEVSLEGTDWGTFDDPDHLKNQGQEIYEELGGWELELDKSQNGSIKINLKNTILHLKNAAKGSEWLAYNELKDAPVFLSAPPWVKEDWKKAQFKDKTVYESDLVDCRVWLSRSHKFEPSPAHMADAFSNLSRLRKFHPVRQYLAAQKWDGVSRLDHWLTTYMGAPDTKYVRAVGRKLLVAAVTRVMQPGVKFDHVVIFEGEQGIGKSSALAILAQPWFCDTLGDITNKDVIAQIQGKWLIEIPELAAMHKAESNALKDFISKQEDRGRLAYARSPQDFPRQCVFIGTTNEDEFLKDITGNRRYWPVEVSKISLDSLALDRDQLWAEAFIEYQMGEEKLWLDDPEVKLESERIQSEKMVSDPWDETVLEWVEEQRNGHPRGAIGHPSGTLTTRAVDVWTGVLARPSTSFDRGGQVRLAGILRRCGFKKVKNHGKITWRMNLWVPRGAPDVMFFQWFMLLGTLGHPFLL